MKKLITILAAMLFAITAFSQEAEQGLSKKEQRKLDKELKKEQQAKEAELKSELIGLMVVYQRFVLEADQLSDKRGNSVQVSSTINFVAADSINSVIQIGQESYVGLNGVGGITIEGPITNYKFTRDEKKGFYNISYNIRSTMGSYDVQITAYNDGRATAMISSNWPGKLNYSGYLVPPVNSRVYKGTSY